MDAHFSREISPARSCKAPAPSMSYKGRYLRQDHDVTTQRVALRISNLIAIRSKRIKAARTNPDSETPSEPSVPERCQPDYSFRLLMRIHRQHAQPPHAMCTTLQNINQREVYKLRSGEWGGGEDGRRGEVNENATGGHGNVNQRLQTPAPTPR